MRIALDFDGTYTEDPILWQAFVAMCKTLGHDVKIVTSRYADPTAWEELQWRIDGNVDVEEAARIMDIPIIYCDMRQKQDVYNADVWVDDKPHMVAATPMDKGDAE